LEETYAGVWIAQSVSGNVVGQKVDVHGSAALALLEK